MILLQTGSLANPTPSLPTEAVQPGQAQASQYLREDGQTPEALFHGTTHTHDTHNLQWPIPVSHLSLPYWQAVAHILISCQITICSLLETTGVQQVALGPGGDGLGVLPLGVGGRPNLQVLGNLLNKSGLPLPSTLGHVVYPIPSAVPSLRQCGWGSLKFPRDLGQLFYFKKLPGC